MFLNNVTVRNEKFTPVCEICHCNIISLYPQDAIRWVLWISLCNAATVAAVCIEISPLPLKHKKIIASLLKFAGCIHNHKIFPGKIFGLILKNKMAATYIFLTCSKEFCWPPRAKDIIGRDLKFA